MAHKHNCAPPTPGPHPSPCIPPLLNHTHRASCSNACASSAKVMASLKSLSTSALGSTPAAAAAAPAAAPASPMAPENNPAAAAPALLVLAPALPAGAAVARACAAAAAAPGLYDGAALCTAAPQCPRLVIRPREVMKPAPALPLALLCSSRLEGLRSQCAMPRACRPCSRPTVRPNMLRRGRQRQ